MVDHTIAYKDHSIVFHDLLESGHNMDKFILNDSVYNRADHIMPHILNILNKDSVVYDIGAYIGTFAIPMALEGMQVLAFEGFPENHARLSKNCKPYPKIQTYQVAVSNKEEQKITKFNDCRDQDQNSEVLIDYVVLDNFINNNSLPKPDFVKLDIEGMETLALLGMTNLIKDVKPIWQIGYHLGIDEDLGDYPGFVSVEDGGFNFDTLFEDYNIFLNGVEVSSFDRWGEYFLIPKK
tara:strand:- start:4203 stop:4913 length:711 start_codon:yes stop_codon:yes gene_type:complete